MRLTNYLIAFFITAGIFMFIYNIRVEDVALMSQKTIEYNNNVDTAVEDAALNLVEVDNNKSLLTNKEAALDAYFSSLYANFGVLNDPSQQTMLQLYTPIFVVVDNDGFYINYCVEKPVNVGDDVADYQLDREWSDKTTYTYADDRYNYTFQLDDTLIILDKKTNKLYHGTRKDIAENPNFPGSLCADEDKFNRIRKEAIINKITKHMRYYINKHNRLVNLAGISYQFSVPIFSDSDWTRTINDISLFAVFQGYPYGSTTDDVYNRYAFGASRITKKKAYYLVASKEDGVIYYHKYNCSALAGIDLEGSNTTTEGGSDNDYGGNSINGNNSSIGSVDHYYSKEECAKAGAFACPVCKP